MTMFTVQLEGAERDALLQMLDMAVKAHGFKVAEAAVVLAKKIASAPEFVAAQDVNNNADPSKTVETNEPS